MDSIVFCYITFPNTQSAEDIAHEAIQQRLAACVNLIPGMTSYYHWEGKVEKGSEIVGIFKTSQSKFEQLKDFVATKHPYDVCCIAKIAIDDIHKPYHQWLSKELGLES